MYRNWYGVVNIAKLMSLMGAACVDIIIIMHAICGGVVGLAKLRCGLYWRVYKWHAYTECMFLYVLVVDYTVYVCIRA